MTYRDLRRRFGQAVAAHDWLEGVSFILGIGFFVLAAACAWGIVVALTNVGDTEAPPTTAVSIGFLEVTRGFAIVLFAILGFLALGVGWFLAGDAIRRRFPRSRGRV